MTTDYYLEIWPLVVASVYDSGDAFAEALPVEELIAASEYKSCPHCDGSGCPACLWEGEYAIVRFKPVITHYEIGRVLSRAEALASRGMSLRNVKAQA